ncbi:hypothetical protein E2C01_060542 [Portunus trituberculatus]|uniref:Uncharacterized protein n=1 Tax=Portunus trituberculatus TaxID=210409 RepID=A0A5B7H9R3_PORTR|nr:hypothetical protein [Portunus trituberculatus]
MCRRTAVANAAAAASPVVCLWAWAVVVDNLFLTVSATQQQRKSSAGAHFSRPASPARYGGYMSEPEGYDSDIGGGTLRYATVDRRRGPQYEADPMTSSLPSGNKAAAPYRLTPDTARPPSTVAIHTSDK